MPIAKEILDMLEPGRKPSQVILVVLFDQKSQKSQRISVPTVAPLHRIIALWVHPLIKTAVF